ncbi:WD40 repeat domain-containing protein [Dactylosporangium sp. NPDC051541]|uniref:WD40 repeat domain-containing protein n=1 Tax=Dactylosporangium sp. NPDC051541 TaxID=3363977 RepID=UPI0037B555EF
MVELFAALPDGPVPPLAADYVDRVLTHARRSARRRRLGAAAAWTAIVAAVCTFLIPGVLPEPAPAAPGQRAALPDRFAGYSTLTSTAERAAPGRAIALYGYGSDALFTMFQQLVVGADADTYRRVGAWDGRGRAPGLLSPDGTWVLLGRAAGPAPELLLVDLTTGRERSVPLGAWLEVRLLAWSPDGRYVAYSAAPDGPAYGGESTVGYDVLQRGTLRLLDVTTGRSTEFPSMGRPSAAAFAPDSARMAVQEGERVHLLRLNGAEDRVVSVGAGRGLAPRAGWSPDGRLLATVPWDGPAPAAGKVEFLAVGADAVAPAPVGDVARVLGWRDAGHLVVATAPGGHGLELAEVTLAAGDRRVLSRFDPGMTCEFGMQHCDVLDLQLATGLLAGLTVRAAGSPDRGPWPWPLRLLVAALAAAGLVVLYGFADRLRVRAAVRSFDGRRPGGGAVLGPY